MSTNWHSWAIGLLGFLFPLLVFSYFRLTKTIPVSIRRIRRLIADAQRLGEPYRDKVAHEFWQQVGSWYRLPMRAENEAQFLARQLFIRCYLRNQSADLQDRRIKMTTKEFTALYWEMTNLLTSPKPQKASRKVLRFHLTAMLPEEFYNGPQIVYQESNSFVMPRILCHRWEEYEHFYPEIPVRGDAKPYSTRLSDWPNLEVKRCIVVREESSTAPNRLGALSTTNELNTASSLYIQDVVRSFAALQNEREDVIRRLFRKTQLEQLSLEELRRILSGVQEQERFNYSPIVESRGSPPASGGAPAGQWIPLLTDFVTKYHNSKADALMWTINANNWNKIVGTAWLKRCFVPGTSPEIVLYQDASLKRWICGLQGQYRPFTRDIEVRFLQGDEAEQLAAELDEAASGTWRELVTDNTSSPHSRALTRGV